MHPARDTASKTAVVEGLRQRLQQLERTEGLRPRSGWQTAAPVLPFDLEPLDSLWPEGGLPRAAVHEVAGRGGLADFAAATAFAASIAGRLTQTILWCARGAELYGPGLYGPGLARVGLAPERLVIAETATDHDALAAMEEGLRYGVLGGVVGEVERLDLTASRRLQLASEKAGVMTLVLRRPARYGPPVQNPIASASRWRIAAAPSTTRVLPQEFFHVPERACWQVELLRSRHGTSGAWLVEAADAQGHLRLPTVLADRSPRATDENAAASATASAVRPHRGRRPEAGDRRGQSRRSA